jgi:hypothetical protein
MHVTLTHASNQESSKAPDATLNTRTCSKNATEKKRSRFPSTWPDKKSGENLHPYFSLFFFFFFFLPSPST